MDAILFAIGLGLLLLIGHFEGEANIADLYEIGSMLRLYENKVPVWKQILVYIWGYVTTFGIAGCGWVVLDFLLRYA